MGNCRCDDIKKIKKDLNLLSEINGRISILRENDQWVAYDLDYLGGACDTAFFSRYGFPAKMATLNGTSTDDIAILQKTVDDLIAQLEGDLEVAKAEDEQHHWEQFLNFFKIF